MPPLVVGVPTGSESLPAKLQWRLLKHGLIVNHLRRKYTNSAATKCKFLDLFKEEEVLQCRKEQFALNSFEDIRKNTSWASLVTHW